MIKEAVLVISMTLLYDTDDVVSVHTVTMPVPGGISECKKMKNAAFNSLFVVKQSEMDGMEYRVKIFCNEK